MSTEARIAAAVASGYLLGRTRKMKLAITVGSLLAGQRIATSPRGLARQGQQIIDANPELAKLQDQLTGKLMEALKAAAVATLSSRLNSVSDVLRDRTDGLRGLAELEPGDLLEEDEPDEDEPEDDEPEEDNEPEQTDEVSRRRSASRSRRSPAKKASGKKTAAASTARKNASRASTARKTAKKAPSTKKTAKKTAAKKTAAKKTADKKSTAKKTAKKASGSRSRSNR